MPRVRVHVTQDDINNGEREEGRHCPIARAITRRMDDLTFVPSVIGHRGAVFVDQEGVSFDDLASTTRWSEVVTDGSPVDFIRAFDAGREVEPFSFLITIPKWSL